MQTVLPRSYVEEFERAARARREDVADKEKSLRFEIRQRERREEQAEETKQREETATTDMMLAQPVAIVEFRAELDVYDTKTVEALMDNQHALDAVRERIDSLLDQSTVLPDGRHVFKTKDGLHVFDEHGQELAPEVIDPARIDNKKPTWETFKEATDERVRLSEEREALAKYQAKLDEARERLDKGEITVGEMKALKAGLAKDMPDAIREKIEHDKPDDPSRKAALTPTPLPDNMDALMRQTGLGSPGAAPAL